MSRGKCHVTLSKQMWKRINHKVIRKFRSFRNSNGFNEFRQNYFYFRSFSGHLKILDFSSLLSL